jgi:serine/threonine protein kinase
MYTLVSRSFLMKCVKLLQRADWTLDIKPANILVDVASESQEIAEVQLADFGSTMSKESKYAKDGEEVGTSVFNSPEIMLSMAWSTPTDIWAFGATVRLARPQHK